MDPTAGGTEALDVALNRLVQCLTPSVQEWQRRSHHVSEHIRQLQAHLDCRVPVFISPFGSSLSGLCLSSSDVDLGVYSTPEGCEWQTLSHNQQTQVLRAVVRAVHTARLAKGQVQAIWTARVPLLKYTCALSGLEVDVSLQTPESLLKAQFFGALNRHCPALGALYRLVKSWAAAHDLNDAATKQTFNSTSLLCMTVFYLQQQEVLLLPPLQWLVPEGLMADASGRLLQGANKQLWAEPWRLQQLLQIVEGNAQGWQGQQQQGQQLRLSQLLQGFLEFWGAALSDWSEGRNRECVADLWQGCWAPGNFTTNYVFRVQDPFDASDCPSRGVGTASNNSRTVTYIKYMFNSSIQVMQRYNRSSSGSSSSVPGNAEPAAAAQQQHELCQLLAWLFGPKVVLLLAPGPPLPPSPGRGYQQHYHQHPPQHQHQLVQQQRNLSHHQQQQQASLQQPGSQQGAVHNWAAAPFPYELKLAVLQRQQQWSHGLLYTWLVVDQLQAGIAEPGRPEALCWEQRGVVAPKHYPKKANPTKSQRTAARLLAKEAAQAAGGGAGGIGAASAAVAQGEEQGASRSSAAGVE